MSTSTRMAFALLGSLVAGCDGSQNLGRNVDAGGKDAQRSDSATEASPKVDGAVVDVSASSDGSPATDAQPVVDAAHAVDSTDARSDSGCLAGGSCVPTSACDKGVVSCSSGVVGCTDTGEHVADGTSCGAGFVCSAGSCNACAASAACVPASNACHEGTTQCDSGAPVCNDTGTPAGDGTPCGNGLACKAGQCVATTSDSGISVTLGWCNVQWPPAIPDEAAGIPLPRAGTTVTWPGHVAAISARVFASGVTSAPGNQSLIEGDIGLGPVGSDPADAAQAFAWSWQPLTFNPSCSGCGQNYEYEISPTAPTTPGVYAYAARFSGNGRSAFAYCSGAEGTNAGQAYDPSAAPDMTVAGTGCQDIGAACGSDSDCCAGAGSCQNSLCTCPGAGQSCTPTNACHKGKIGCSAATTPSCEDTGTPVTNGTSCGTGQTCQSGACTVTTCTKGASCVPTNPCDTGIMSCNGSVGTCNDTGSHAPNGTSCGTGMVCKAGACVSCSAAASCTPTNPCHEGSVDCSSGSPVCTDTGTDVTDGSSCGTGLVCTSGSCGCEASLTSCPPDGCVDTTTDSNNCEVCGYSCASGTICINSACSKPATLPIALSDFASVLGPDGQVYVLGGDTVTGILRTGLEQSSGPFASMYVYSPVTNVWSTGPSMTNARMNLAATVGRDGRIYALGGTGTGETTLSSVEIYDTTTQKWSPGPSMLLPRAQFGAAVGGDGRIYAIEGLSAGQPTKSCEALDTTTHKWSSIATLSAEGNSSSSTWPPPPEPLVLGGQDGHIYAFLPGSPTVMIYDFAGNSWSDGPTVLDTQPQYFASGAVLPNGNFILSIFVGTSSGIEEYDPVAGELVGWPGATYPLSSMLPPFGIVAGLIDGRMIALGAETFGYGIYSSLGGVALYDPTAGWSVNE